MVAQASAGNTPARGQALGTKGGIEVVGRARGELSKFGSVHRDREEMQGGADAAREDDPRSVRRPGGVMVVVCRRCQLAYRAGGKRVEINITVGSARGSCFERELSSVW